MIFERLNITQQQSAYSYTDIHHESESHFMW